MSTPDPAIENATAKAARLKREAAERSREYRRRQKLERTPDVRRVDAAIVEAFAFTMAKYCPQSAAVRRQQPLSTAALPVLELLATSTDILVHDGYSREKSRTAVAERVASRPEHGDSTNVPSLHPVDDPARVQPARRMEGDPPPAVLPVRRQVATLDDWSAILLEDDGHDP